MKSPQDNVSLTIPAKAQYIELVRYTLLGIASRMGYSYEDIEDMKVAVSEACNNVVLHAYGGENDGCIEIRFELGQDRLAIVVRDTGISFSYEDARSEPLTDKPLELVEPGGLGIYMMQALMDEVAVQCGDGTEVRLVKMLRQNENIA